MANSRTTAPAGANERQDGRATAAAARMLVPRRAQRLKAFRLVWLDTSAGTFRAHILNLSTIGACVHARCEHRAWSGVVLRSDELALQGRVTWTNHDLFGVKFVQPLSEADVRALVEGEPPASV